MVKINEQQAREFIESVSPKDKIGIIVHHDLDGMTSGVLFYDYCKQKGCKDIKPFPFTFSKTHISSLDLEDRTKLFVADIGENLLLPDLNSIKIPVLYTDHHHSENLTFNDNILEYRIDREGYFPSSRTVFELCGGKDWLSLVGTISDFGDKYPENKTFVEGILNKYGKSASEFGRDFVYPAANFLVYFEKDLERAFDFLTHVKDLKQFSKLRKFAKLIEKEITQVERDFNNNSEKFGNIHFYLINSPYNIKTLLVNRISSVNPEDVYILGCRYGEEIGFSARNQAKIYDMRTLLKTCTQEFIEVNSGGHSAAAGASISCSHLEKFRQNLKGYNLEEARVKHEEN
jgi:single-stranded DNA-specific DHH superfamily exonuclease